MTSIRIVPWLSRVVLLAAIAVLALISRKFIGNPVEAATASNMTLNSPLAVTNLFVLSCLATSSLRKTGLGFVALIVGTALAVRIFGIVADGTLAESLRVLVAEAVLLGLSLGAYTGERLAFGNSASRRA